MPRTKQVTKSRTANQKSVLIKSGMPTITHLQFLALDLLMLSPEGLAAQLLMEGIAQTAPDYSGPKFYQLMKRLIDSKLVACEVKHFEVVGSKVARTFYAITPTGNAARGETLRFYSSRITGIVK